MVGLRIIFFCLIPLILSSFRGFSQYASYTERALAHIGIQESQCHENLFAEKELPFGDHDIVVVIPEMLDSYDDGMFEIQGHIVLLNKEGNLKGHFTGKSTSWISDAIQLYSIEIDVARYFVQENNRAFGIRVKYNGMSRANPYDYTTLSLFTFENNQLREVLSSFEVHLFAGEWDTNCAGEFQTQESILIMQSTKHHNFFDILLKNEFLTEIWGEDENAECDVISSNQAQSKETLIFDGKKYVLKD